MWWVCLFGWELENTTFVHSLHRHWFILQSKADNPTFNGFVIFASGSLFPALTQPDDRKTNETATYLKTLDIALNYYNVHDWSISALYLYWFWGKKLRTSGQNNDLYMQYKNLLKMIIFEKCRTSTSTTSTFTTLITIPWPPFVLTGLKAILNHSACILFSKLWTSLSLSPRLDQLGWRPVPNSHQYHQGWETHRKWRHCFLDS